MILCLKRLLYLLFKKLHATANAYTSYRAYRFTAVPSAVLWISILYRCWYNLYIQIITFRQKNINTVKYLHHVVWRRYVTDDKVCNESRFRRVCFDFTIRGEPPLKFSACESHCYVESVLRHHNKEGCRYCSSVHANLTAT
jgi:hypothetical protein